MLRRVIIEVGRDVTPALGGGVSFVFMLPGVSDTLRLNGSVEERQGSQLSIAVEEAFIHCPKCILRSGLWRPPRPRRTAPVASGGVMLFERSIADFLASAPFAIISTWDASGASDTSPRGDPPGFLEVLDADTIAIPDRKGNQRIDTFHNLMACDRLSLAAVVPGRQEVLHLHGAAWVTDEPAILSRMALKGKAPHLALCVHILGAELVANEAISASRPWQPSSHVRRSELPDFIDLGARHLARNRDKGMKAAIYRLVARVLGAFPSFAGRFLDKALRSDLAKEGYDETRPGLGSRRSHVNDRVRVGDALEIIGPSGAFALDPDPTKLRELVLIAGGSGITPIACIARTVLAGEPKSRVVLLYGNRGTADIIFAETLTQLCKAYGERFQLRHVLQNPPDEWSGGGGILDEATLRSELEGFPRTANARYFVCGPEPMLLGARRALQSLGVAEERIHEERSSAPRIGGAKEAAKRRLTMIVQQSGREIGTTEVAIGKTLLEAGLDAGLPMPFSCAMGNCGECRVRLTSGEVELDEPNGLTPEERAQGYVLTCVARPLTATGIEIDAEP